MKTKERQPSQGNQPITNGPKPSRRYVRRQRLFLGMSLALVVALVIVFLNQFGVISFLHTKTTSSLSMVTAEGVLEDAQTNLPMAHVPISARIFSFETETVTNAQGHFSVRVPDSAKITVSVPHYDPQSITPGIHLQVRLAPDAATTAQRYMSAFMSKQYDQVWNMMDPDTQAFWGTEADFTAFLTHKFGPLPLLSFTIGQDASFSSWINPDTTQAYNNVVTMPVTLKIGPSNTVLTPPSAQAVEQGLFDNLNFAETKSNGLWRVLLGGPLDREAPIVVPANAPNLTIKVPVLMYHHVSPGPSPSDVAAGLGSNTVKTPDFATQINYLAQSGYHPVILTDIFNKLYYGLPLPAHPIIISFDDGYEDNFTDAFPILQSHHFVAEINIITGIIGGGWLTWDQIRQMAASGFQIGSHTVHHYSLTAITQSTAQHELADSKSTLEQQIGKPVQFFCYPSGEPFAHGTSDQRQFIISQLYQDGYVGALLDPGVTSADQNAQTPYQLYRIRVSGDEDMSLFTQTLQDLGVGPGEGSTYT
ncbi:MAG TPA: polysaccharide deacetylase family protein [Ktedonobacterales bacterium]|nr:polysaccharide deacetylase family protein [Ktedonobacterales bacterium]